MTITRRKTLTILGGGFVAAAAGAGTFAATRTPHAAVAPWTTAGNYSDPRKRHLSFAILSPNPHNMQPWLIDLSKPNQATLLVNMEKLLPHTDPFNRQITIGLGGFLELLRMAAAQDGMGVTITQFPDGSSETALDHRPIAHIKWDGSAVPDPLFAHVMTRQSLKEPYDVTRSVPHDAMDRITAVADGTGFSLEPDDITHWRKITQDALLIEIQTPRTYQESVDVFRIGKREINATPDGIDFSGAFFETLNLMGQFDRQVVLDTTSTAYTAGIDAVLENARTAMGHMWITTPANTRQDQLAAGAAWLRMNLAAQAEGIATQPLSQALQEYPEMAEHYAHIHNRLAPNGETVQMFARVGYGERVAQSPRWPLEAKVIGSKAV
ncbi:MAG: twin-arginine translocation pathway signal protein [Pseudomonadota bacterium]